jgi:uncharacterized metal-binding protein
MKTHTQEMVIMALMVGFFIGMLAGILLEQGFNKIKTKNKEDVSKRKGSPTPEKI